MTFDCLLEAERDPEWKRTLEAALLSSKPRELSRKNLFRLSFEPARQMITIRPYSEDSLLRAKIVPKKLTYKLAGELMNGNLSAFAPDNVFDADTD